MSLATRCTACGTVFRVVQDQLKVSEGWVRCGRCQEVFNALEALFDLDRAASPSPAAGAAAASSSGRMPFDAGPEAAGDMPVALFGRPAEMAPVDTMADSRSPSRLDSDDAEMPLSSGGDSELADGDDFADARFNTALIEADEAAEAEAEAAAAEASLPADIAPQTLLDEAFDAPSAPTFVQEADRAALRRRPAVRIALALGAAALLAALVLQLSLQFHDALASRWPALHAPLTALCEAAGCVIEAPRNLAAVSVDSSGLARTVDNAEAYRFSLVLRNHADFDVATPAVELTLTDSNGQLVTRRVFWPADFGNAAPEALAPSAETGLQLVLASGQRISGYTVEIFYP